jgi:hypothetical protein
VEATALDAGSPDLWIPILKPERSESLKVFLTGWKLGEATRRWDKYVDQAVGTLSTVILTISWSTSPGTAGRMEFTLAETWLGRRSRSLQTFGQSVNLMAEAYRQKVLKEI